MSMTTLTALYDSRAEAERAADELMAQTAISRSSISIIAQESGTTATTTTSDADDGFFASLGRLFMPETDRYSYSEAVRRGGYLLTAQLDESLASAGMDILDNSGAVDLSEREASWRSEGWTGTPAAGTTAAVQLSGTTGGDETIRLAEERLAVGKRQVDAGRIRVRSYVVETPVQEQVSLHEEHVSIERRPVDRPATAADTTLFADKVIEATATREEAVVSKTAHVTEELVIKKTAEDRVETVSDSVRSTKVEVENDAATTGTTTTTTTTGQPGFVPPRR